MKLLGALAAFALLSVVANAAQAPDSLLMTGPNFQQVPSNKIIITPDGGTQTTLGAALSPQGLNLTGANASGANVTPTGALTAATTAALAAQQGVLLDTFKSSSDPDDTASMTRAVAAGVPILLGPRTYTINNYLMSGTPANFVLIGRRGQSIIQRTSASGSNFFSITAANVVIDGVIFDSNMASVSANQWGILLTTGGQNVSVRNSVFKNNSGTIGSCFALLSTGPAAGGSFNFSDNEVTNCAFNSLYLGSVSNGIVSRNYIHDVSSFGIWAGSNGAASATNYATNIIIADNTILRTTNTAISVGGIASPFAFGTPSATHVRVANNITQDSTIYGISLEGDYLSAAGNHINQSAPSVTQLGGIDVLSRFGLVENNTIVLTASYGIDIGGSQDMLVQGNAVTMPTGTAYNTGGNLNSVITRNVANLSGTAQGVTNYAIEGTGAGGIFPTASSNTQIDENTFNMTGSSTQGIAIYDNAGGGTGNSANTIRRNKFNITGSGTNPTQAIALKVGPHSVQIDGNQMNGTNVAFIDPNGSGDLLFDYVNFGGVIQGVSSTTNIRSIVTKDVNTYGANGSVLWVTPSAGGSNYVAATTTINFSGTGCTGQAGTAEVNNGAIIGVKMTNYGSGCSGSVTASATDTSGGSGATFSLGTFPALPDAATLRYEAAATHLLLSGGGFLGINPPYPIVLATTNSPIALQVGYGGTFWLSTIGEVPRLTTANLPTCNSAANGAWAIATDALTPTYLGTLAGSGAVTARVECNGTNWLTH